MRRIKNITLLSVAALLITALLFSNVIATANTTIPQENTEQTEIIQPEISTEEKLIGLLNLNHCFNDDFNENEILIEGTQISLLDFSVVTDDATYINRLLVESFIENFYGKNVSTEGFGDAGYSMPETYMKIASKGYATVFHTLISMNVDEMGNCTLVTCLNFYNHDATKDTCLCKSVFVKNDSSAYGYNLVKCEIL